ncbi:helix-turn-helix domain-containing protein [Gottfriedia sp. NPDC057948]|uniref:helix-turn-helix domain-containing protein n=1 Tax=Gottfriedia sp. NPDC057948 TaxID=3346287 RepID=UPI0036DE5BE9
MEVTINIPDDMMKEFNKHIGYYNLKNDLIGEEYEATLNDVVLGALKMYLQWTAIEPSPLIKTEDLIIEAKYIDILKKQRKKQKEVVDQSGIPKSTVSALFNGGLPSLENFIRIWIALGQPPIQHLLSVKPTE